MSLRPAVQRKKCHPNPAHPEWAVWLPEQIWGGAAAAVREAVARLDDPRRIRGVAVTGMGMDGLRSTARALALPLHKLARPAHRAAARVVGAARGPGADVLHRRQPGLAYQQCPADPLDAENEPAVFARTDKWLLIEDFVNFMLCGRRATDYSMASARCCSTSASSIGRRNCCAAQASSRRLLCDAYPSGTLLGEVHAEASRATAARRHAGGPRRPRPSVRRAAGRGLRPGVVLGRDRHLGELLTATPEPVLDPATSQDGMTVQAHVARGMHVVVGEIGGRHARMVRRQFGDAFP